VLQSKITMPLCGPHLVRRAAIEEALDRGARVTTVIGSAGFGKTTAVAAWASRLPAAVAWYTIDAYDNRPSVFWRHLTGAIARVCPLVTAGDESMVWLSSGSEPVELVAALGPDPDPTVVVLDDLHLVEDATIFEQLAYFVERAPASLRFVLIARVAPRLPWGRWAVRDQLAEVSEQHLSMNRGEATALVRRSATDEVDGSAVDAVVAAASGWPAALRLAGLTLGTANHTEAYAASVLAQNRLFFAFVAGEVLDNLPGALRETAVVLSLFDDLDPRRCESFCGLADGRALLDDLARRGLPMIALDPDSHGYRFHALFREVLAAELVATRGPDLRDLHLRVAAAELAVGDEPAAVRHFIAAGALDTAFDIVFTPLADMYRNGSLRRMADWIDRFPPDFVSGSAARSAAYALAMTYLGRREEAERWSRLATDLAVEPPRRLDVAVTLPRVLLALDRGDTEAVRGEVTALRSRHPEEALDRDRDSQVHTAMAIASLADERLDDAAYWVSAIVRRPDLPERARMVGQPTRAAWEAFLRGALDRSAVLARWALDAGGEAGRAAIHAVIELYALQAALALERCDLEQAAYWSARAADRVAHMPPCLHRYLVDRVAIAVAEACSGIEVAMRACRTASHGAPPVLAVRYELVAADIEARAALRKAAARRLATLPPSPRRTLLFARMAAYAGRSEVVRAHLDGLGEVPKALQIEAQLLRARAAAGSDAFAQAVAAGAGAGYVWTYRREGPDVDELLRHALTFDRQWFDTPLAASLRAGGDRHEAVRVTLSEAERRVLAYLPSHRSKEEVASELHLSVNTVKTHVSAIYAKLGVGQRDEAVRRARELGLLQ